MWTLLTGRTAESRSRTILPWSKWLINTKNFMTSSSDRKKLRIAQVAPLWFSIPPKKYGGIERVVSLLTEELVRRGHEVTLFAAAGSETSAKLVSVFPQPLIEAGIPWSSPVWSLRNLSKAFEIANSGDFD